MTLVISTLTSSGIVLSADSRQTYRNIAGVIRIGSDSATKVFKLTDRCGVAISGRAFLIDGDQQQKDVGYFITQFKRIYDAERNSTESKEHTLNYHQLKAGGFKNFRRTEPPTERENG